jgi:TetR/AcrR family transcriptional regulator, mexJK operon transcriptional repressor
MTDALRPVPLGRPPDAEKRRAVLAATRTVFLQSGFDGLSIEAVAALAGVSKVTVYKQFVDRGGLLAALVGAESDWMEAILADLSLHGPDFRAALTAGCQRLMAFLLRRDVMDFDAQMQLGSARHPDLVARFVAAGPGRLHAALDGAMTLGMAEGQLAPGDAGKMTGTLMGLLFAVNPPPVRFGLAPPLDDAERDRRVAAAVERFLVLFAQEKGPAQ